MVGSTPGDWFAVFSRNTTMASPDFGKLTPLQSFQDNVFTVPITCSGVGPTQSGVAVSPDGLFVIVASPFAGALATFSRAADGRLSFIEAICDDLLVVDDDIGAIVELAASADGRSLYTAGGAFSFLTVVDYECDSANVDLVLTMDSVSDMRTETACRSAELGPDYHVLAAGDLMVVSPVIKMVSEVSFAGDTALINAVP